MTDDRGPAVGDVLGSYVLKRLLGVGGMGLVYLAEHERLKRKVALKLLRPELATDPVAIRRFFAEARAVNEVGHENIVEITDFVDEGPHRFFVMEFLQGHALSDVLALGRIPLRRTLHIARQIAAALAAAHESGVVHRDLKPPNIFLIKRGSDDAFVKVLDFGIAKVRSIEPAEREQTVAGTFIGTPAYMAPEQLRQTPSDHRVDVYAFGVMLFELVTGRRPFEASSMAEIVVMQLTAPPPRPSVVMQHAPGGFALPEQLEELILACLEKEPEKRMKTMRHVELALDRIAPLVESMPHLPGAKPDIWPSAAVTTGSGAAKPVVEPTDAAKTNVPAASSARPPTSPTVHHDVALTNAIPARAPSRGRRTLIAAGIAAGLVGSMILAIAVFASGGDEPALVATTTFPSSSSSSNANANVNVNVNVTNESADANASLHASANADAGPNVNANNANAGANVNADAGANANAGPNANANQESLSTSAAPAVPTLVEVSFTSKPPGATVVVGGKVLGVTPLRARVNASAKPQPVMFKLEGHAPKTVVTVMSAPSGAVTATLLPVVPAPAEEAGTATNGALINPFKKKPK